MDLILNSTFETPSVRFIESSGIFFIKGRVIPTKESVFWININTWVSESITSFNSPINLTIEVEYINAYSVSQLLNLISSLNIISSKGYKLTVNWICSSDEEDEIFLIGQDIATTVDCIFNFKQELEEI